MAPASEGRNDPNGEAGNFIFLTKSNLADRVILQTTNAGNRSQRLRQRLFSAPSLVFLRGAVAKIIDGITELSHRLGRSKNGSVPTRLALYLDQSLRCPAERRGRTEPAVLARVAEKAAEFFQVQRFHEGPDLRRGAAWIDGLVEAVAVQNQQRYADGLQLIPQTFGEATIGHRTSAKHVVIEQETGDLGVRRILRNWVARNSGSRKPTVSNFRAKLRYGSSGSSSGQPTKFTSSNTTGALQVSSMKSMSRLL